MYAHTQNPWRSHSRVVSDHLQLFKHQREQIERLTSQLMVGCYKSTPSLYNYCICCISLHLIIRRTTDDQQHMKLYHKQWIKITQQKSYFMVWKMSPEETCIEDNLWFFSILSRERLMQCCGHPAKQTLTSTSPYQSIICKLRKLYWENKMVFFFH